jgi:hypothetical protein
MAFTDSSIGFTTVALADPAAHTDSPIGFTTVSLSDPGGGVTYGDSAIGYAVVTLSNPVRPVAVLTSTGLRFVPIRTWDGTTLR